MSAVVAQEVAFCSKFVNIGHLSFRNTYSFPWQLLVTVVSVASIGRVDTVLHVVSEVFSDVFLSISDKVLDVLLAQNALLLDHVGAVAFLHLE